MERDGVWRGGVGWLRREAHVRTGKRMRVGEAHVGTGKRERMRGARWELERDGGGGAVANLGRKKGTAAAEKGAGWVKEMGVFRRGNHVTIHQLQKYEILEL